MTTKRILFAVLCVLLLLVIIMSAVVLSRVSTLFAPPAPNSNTTPSTSHYEPTGESSTAPSESTGATEPSGHVHDFVLSEKLDATCTGYGWNIYVCSGCGHMDMPQDERIDPLGHDFVEGEAVAPSCTEGGYTEFKCTRCSETEHRNETDALGHLFDNGTEVSATCQVGGHVLFTCTREGCEETKQEALNNGALGEHSFGDWVLSTDGTQETHTCSVCGTEESRTPEAPQEALKITSHVPTPSQDGTVTIHIVTVGTTEAPLQHTYQIFDYTNNASLNVTYNETDGLLVTYVDATGEPQTTALGTTSVIATLDENGLQVSLG